MKLNHHFLAGVILATGLALAATAQTEPPVELAPVVVSGTKPKLGPEKSEHDFIWIEVRNFQDESLGRITDLGVDLVNGRIVEALVESDSSLGVGDKIVAVPPLALLPDPISNVYRLDASPDTFKAAAAIDVTKWEDAGRSQRVAAAYRLFGQEPYFLEEGDTASTTDARPKVRLGYVERCNQLLDLPVGNLQGQALGQVWSLTLDIPNGRILNVILFGARNALTKSIVPAMALSFNAARDGLLLDDTKPEFASEPRLIYTPAAYGHAAHSREESYRGPRTSVALEQGRSYRDIDQTVRVNRDIRAAKINVHNVQVGTLNDRVTLRGWVDTAEDRRRIGEIAIADARLELVDNQITVGRTVTGG